MQRNKRLKTTENSKEIEPLKELSMQSSSGEGIGPRWLGNEESEKTEPANKTPNQFSSGEPSRKIPRYRRSRIICPYCAQEIWTQVEKNWINALKCREESGILINSNGPFCYTCDDKIPLSAFHEVSLDWLIYDI